MSERDGNMELYKGHAEGVTGGHRPSFKRLTYSPTLQVKLYIFKS